MVLVFAHAPLIGMEKGETEGIQVLFEQEHEKDPRAAIPWLTNLYKGYKKNYADLVADGHDVVAGRLRFQQNQVF